MTDVFQFVPRAGRKAKGNLAEFIRRAKEDLTAFGDGGAWQSDRWQHRKQVIIFATKTATCEWYVFTSMADPFKQFAKAYVRYQYSHQPNMQIKCFRQALACIEAALLKCCGRADILLLNGAVMDASAEFCREFHVSKVVWCQTGRALQKIFNFCRISRITPALPQWKSPFKKQASLTEVLGEEGESHRSKKLPSNETMLMMADLFANSKSTEARFFTSINIILMAAPSRISEVLALPIDCIQWDLDDRGERQMYIQWRAAKGKGAMKKWVVPAMREVVEEAVRRLLEIGAAARLASLFAFKNPGKFMMHPKCITDERHKDDQPLTSNELCAGLGRGLSAAIGGGAVNAIASHLKRSKHLTALLAREAVSYNDLAEYVHRRYAGSDWPYIDSSKTVKTYEALCLHRECEFHATFEARPFSWRLPRVTEVNRRFSPEIGLSLFDRAGMRNPDGSNVRLTTHQLRHWLSTMCERAGMDAYTLAQWAGRANARDNQYYDHRSSEERFEIAREIVLGQEPTLLERLQNRQAVSYQELGVDRIGIAKATLYGMCVHDYAMMPCQKQRECMTCKEHVCIKGDHVSLDRIRILEDQTSQLLLRAQVAHKDGIFGADRWVDNHKWKLAHIRLMRVMLERSDVPEGAIVRIPDAHDPSPVLRALMYLGMADAPATGVVNANAFLPESV